MSSHGVRSNAGAIRSEMKWRRESWPKRFDGGYRSVVAWVAGERCCGDGLDRNAGVT